METGSTAEAELLGDVLLDPRIDVGEGPDRPRNGAGRDLGARRDQPGAIAGEGRIVAGQLDAERRGLGMDAVAAADGKRVLVLQRALPERGEQAVDVAQQDVGGLGELDGEAGVEHVRRGHALVHEARLRADELAQPGQEGDDVVLGHALDGVDLLDVALGIGLKRGHRLLAAVPDRLGGVLGNDPELGHGVAGMRLDLEPDAEAVLGGPDGRHLRPGVAGKHGRAFSPDDPAPPC